MHESLLADKESDMDQVKQFEKLSYRKNAGALSKIAFSWIFELISVFIHLLSSATRTPSIKKILKN